MWLLRTFANDLFSKSPLQIVDYQIGIYVQQWNKLVW